MARYAQRLKDQAVARLLPPESAAVDTVAHEMGIGVATLERWRAEALGAPRTERAWTAAARWEAVIATAALDEAACSAWCREQGLYPSDLTAWRDQAIAAGPPRLRFELGPRRPARIGGAFRSSSARCAVKTRL